MSCSSPDQWTTFLTRNAYEFLDMLAIRCFIVFSAHIIIATRAILVCRFASFRSMAMHVDYVVSRIFEAITAIWILNRIKLAFGCLRYPFFLFYLAMEFCLLQCAAFHCTKMFRMTTMLGSVVCTCSGFLSRNRIKQKHRPCNFNQRFRQSSTVSR